MGFFDSIIGAVAGPLVGGLLGGASSKSASGGTQTAERTPWGPAVPWLTNQLEEGKKLQDYYTQNPFNQQQQTAYQNTFADIDNFRNNIAPGLFDKANSMLGYNYQRPSYSTPGLLGYGGNQQSNNAGNSFDENYYLQQKLKWLADNPDKASAAGWNGGNTQDLKAVMAQAGMTPSQHYAQYGRDEGISAVPNVFKPATGGSYGLLNFNPAVSAPVAQPQASQTAPAMGQADIDARIKEALAGQYNYFSPFYNGGAGG
jgi:hypothetical protein